MLSGPTIILQCSACQKPIEEHTAVESDDIPDAVFWTDGRRYAPVIPDEPLLVMCPHCHAPLWLDELEELGTFEPLDDWRDEFSDAREYVIPAPDDYFALLDSTVDNPEKEHYIRLNAWWTLNDERRESPDEIPLSSRETYNLKSLARMLDESDDHDRVMKAEIMRELGRFPDALALLSHRFDDDMAEAVEIIRSLAQKNDRYVREMQF
ncbi:MAG: hypothetical protein HZC28_14770 [Spirochaetes bacterium]|nr:hypothetical protein [Spirochaetota bacterium]